MHSLEISTNGIPGKNILWHPNHLDILITQLGLILFNSHLVGKEIKTSFAE